MSAKTTKMEAAKLISEYRENELKRKDPDLKRLQLLAGNNRTPASANARRIALIVLILAIIVGILWFKSCSAAHNAGKKDMVSLKKVYERIWPFSSTSNISKQAPVPSPYVTNVTDASGATVLTKNDLRVTQDGSLVIDRHSRTVIEELSAVSDLHELHEELEALRNTLPPAAARQACDLVERYYRFQTAFANRMAPNDIGTTPRDAEFALDQLHALRVEFFGPALAQLWFAEEEAFGRALIENQWKYRK